MRTIDDILETHPQTILYHYTSLNGLLGIVKSRSLWASNIFYFNDASEITYARDILKRVITESKESVGKKEKCFLCEFYAWLDSFGITIYQFFVYSLTE